MSIFRTRFAPTPSGYLHLGNAWSFVLTWLLARSRGGTIHLRIDDLDTARLRVEYVDDIFASLEWLGLDWDTGPRSPAEFHHQFSQRLRLPDYQAALLRLSTMQEGDGPAVYACECSRGQARRDAEAAGIPPGVYPGTCRAKGLNLSTPEASWRLRVPEGEDVLIPDIVAGGLRMSPARELGDFVIRQRNGDPAYQLASVVDDEALGIDLVVRGMDLLPSTAGQMALARRLGARTFSTAEFLHHGLIVEATLGTASPEGSPGKLSKSAGDGPGEATVHALRQHQAGPEVIYGFFARLLGMDPAGKYRAADLLEGFDAGLIPTAPIRWEDFRSS